jgi:hypothetical protein
VKILSSPILHIQISPDHVVGRVVGESGSIRRECTALGRGLNAADIREVKQCLRSLKKALVPGFSLRKPRAFLHFLPAQFPVTPEVQKKFADVVYAAGFDEHLQSVHDSLHSDDQIRHYFSSGHWV